MNWTEDNLDKLETILQNKYENLIRSSLSINEAFLDFCDKYEIIMIEKEELRWWLNFNKDHAVVENPERLSDDFFYIAIPNAFAEKCLILGYAPD